LAKKSVTTKIIKNKGNYFDFSKLLLSLPSLKTTT